MEVWGASPAASPAPGSAAGVAEGWRSWPVAPLLHPGLCSQGRARDSGGIKAGVERRTYIRSLLVSLTPAAEPRRGWSVWPIEAPMSGITIPEGVKIVSVSELTQQVKALLED